MVGKAPIYKLSRRKKTRNAANLDKNQWTCFVVQHGHRPLTSAIIFLTQVSLQKFPFLFIIMIPWLHNLLQSIIPWSLARYIFLLACIDNWKVYNRLVLACTVKTTIKVKCLCVSTSKKRHSCRAASFLTVFFVWRAAINLVNLVFRTTIIEDTHLTLSVILFKAEASNSLIFLPLQTCWKKFAEFPFLYSL